MVYDAYVEDMLNNDELAISFSTFLRIWTTEFPHLKIKQVSISHNLFIQCIMFIIKHLL